MLPFPGLPTDIYVSPTHHEYYQASIHHLNIEMNTDFLISANEVIHLHLLKILRTISIIFYDKNGLLIKIKVDCHRWQTFV